jgi:hypothetical protein
MGYILGMPLKTRKAKRKTRKFWPKRYYSGLSKTKRAERAKEIAKFGALSWRDPKAYVGFKTNIGRKTRKSSYITKWYRMFPNAKSLEQKAEATGIPLDLLKQSYNRGMAAWRTGHRPGATAQQWGYGRVASFLLCGKTANGPDADLVRKAKATKAGKKWFRKCPLEQ